MNVLPRALLFFSSSIVLPGFFGPFKPTILVTSTLVHLLEYITVMIITTATIAPVTIVIISLDFCFEIVYDIANLIYPISTSSGTLLILT